MPPSHAVVPLVVAQASSGYSSTSRTDSDGCRTDWDRSHSSQVVNRQNEVELTKQLKDKNACSGLGLRLIWIDLKILT
jgi:hypothetical protein